MKGGNDTLPKIVRRDLLTDGREQTSGLDGGEGDTVSLEHNMRPVVTVVQ